MKGVDGGWSHGSVTWQYVFLLCGKNERGVEYFGLLGHTSETNLNIGLFLFDILSLRYIKAKWFLIFLTFESLVKQNLKIGLLLYFVRYFISTVYKSKMIFA